MDYLSTRKDGVYCGKEPFLLRGVGFGNWLLPEGYMWKFYDKCDRPRRIEQLISVLCGRDYALSFWEKFYDLFITKDDIRWIKEQGLNSVRLPINSRSLFHFNNGEVTFNHEVLRKVDDCINWCREFEVYLFIDMHGAPGGQTGTNIDDSIDDIPHLFTEPENEELLLKCWELLANRYKDKPEVGGYDLLNEPLPEWNQQHYPKLIPLYRKLIKRIRAIDRKHILVLEGVNWSSDFSVFSEFSKEELKDNILLEFHKYWSNPDKESIQDFIDVAKSLEVPLWMGEGGENNLDWYTTVFPMYEKHNIGWCFWSYKKMDTRNSLVSYDEPNHWSTLLDYIDGQISICSSDAKMIFDGYLESIAHPRYQNKVIAALLRETPLEIPAFAYDSCDIHSKRIEGAKFRLSDPVSIVFEDGHKGIVDWKRYGGEEQPPTDRLEVILNKDDSLKYRVTGFVKEIVYSGDGEVTSFDGEDGFIQIKCTRGKIHLKRIVLNNK